jgi:hypothetical protein
MAGFSYELNLRNTKSLISACANELWMMSVFLITSGLSSHPERVGKQ